MEIEEVGRKWREGAMDFKQVMLKDIEMDRRERWEKIGMSKFNRWYGWIKGEEVPGYLEKG